MVVSSNLSFIWQCQNHVKSHPGPHTPLLPDTTPPDFLFSQCEIPRGSFNSLWSIVSMSPMVQVALSAVLSGQLKHMCSAFARPWVQLPVVGNKERKQKNESVKFWGLWFLWQPWEETVYVFIDLKTQSIPGLFFQHPDFICTYLFVSCIGIRWPHCIAQASLHLEVLLPQPH